METVIKKKVRNSGHPVIRDYIPADDAATPAEQSAFKLGRGGGGRPDFIPGPDHQLQKGAGRGAQADEALERALRAQSFAVREEFEVAVKKLQELNVADAVAHIVKLPFAQQELFLAAESIYGQRKSLLGQFPPPDPAVADKYRAILEEEKATADPKPTEEKE